MEATAPNPKHAANKFLLFGVLLVIVLYYGRELLVPLVYGAFFAMLMAPVCRKLEEKNLNRTIAVVICVLILLICLLAIFAIIVGQITSFIDDLPAIQKKLYEVLTEAEKFIQRHFDVSPPRQIEIVKQQIANAGKSTGSYFGQVLTGISGTLGGLILTVVYTFLLLFHKERYETFFMKLYGKDDPKHVAEVINDITCVGQKYISGRFITVVILWVVYTVALMMLGIKEALLLSAIAALLSIIPYVGTILGSIFPFLVAFISKDLATAFWVAAVLMFLHSLSTYFIEPIVIGRKVKLSAMAMIVAIIAGGFLWGISGMILFIPALAMARIVFEYVDRLKPYSYLIADPDEGKPSKMEDWVMDKFRKKKTHKTVPSKKK
jgi:predicted PurR-regulated permease PerM